jgi:hypothetical protein
VSQHVFVDENKSRSLLLAAACFHQGELRRARLALTELLLPGQERVHFKSERDVRRRVILDVILGSGMDGLLLGADPTLAPRDQRRQCLERLMFEAESRKFSRICIEQDDSVLDFDRQRMFEAMRIRNLEAGFSYGWMRPRQEPLLWAADAIAWAWARGGQWRKRLGRSVEFIDLTSS